MTEQHQQEEQDEDQPEEEIAVERIVESTIYNEDLGDVELQQPTAAIDDETNSSKRLLLRQQVLAEIFPSHTEHQSIRFDAEANQYVLVENEADDSRKEQPEIAEKDNSTEPTSLKTSPGSIEDERASDSPPATEHESTEGVISEIAEEGDSNDGNNDDDDVLTCSICLDVVRPTDSKVSAAKCAHVYHCACLMEWMLIQPKSRRRGDRAESIQHDSCPTCRTELWDAQVYKQLEVAVADRLGVELEDLWDNNNASSEPWIVEEGVLSGRYVQWGLTFICCCSILLYIIASVLVPSLTSGVRRWW